MSMPKQTLVIMLIIRVTTKGRSLQRAVLSRLVSPKTTPLPPSRGPVVFLPPSPLTTCSQPPPRPPRASQDNQRQGGPLALAPAMGRKRAVMDYRRGGVMRKRGESWAVAA